jgi:hypothetical protein
LITLGILLGESCYNWHPYAYGLFLILNHNKILAERKRVTGRMSDRVIKLEKRGRQGKPCDYKY